MLIDPRAPREPRTGPTFAVMMLLVCLSALAGVICAIWIYDHSQSTEILREYNEQPAASGCVYRNPGIEPAVDCTPGITWNNTQPGPTAIVPVDPDALATDMFVRAERAVATLLPYPGTTEFRNEALSADRTSVCGELRSANQQGQWTVWFDFYYRAASGAVALIAPPTTAEQARMNEATAEYFGCAAADFRRVE